MSREELKAKIKAAAPEGKIACAAAMRLAEDLVISRQDMGKLLNELRIKLKQCQLGCF
jgi:hypothetical protein